MTRKQITLSIAIAAAGATAGAVGKSLWLAIISGADKVAHAEFLSTAEAKTIEEKHERDLENMRAEYRGLSAAVSKRLDDIVDGVTRVEARLDRMLDRDGK